MSLTTEEQAKEMWCPKMALLLATIANVDLKQWDVQGNVSTDKCVASRCMWWRWAYRFVHTETGEGTHYDPPQGYCGMAGKP